MSEEELEKSEELQDEKDKVDVGQLNLIEENNEIQTLKQIIQEKSKEIYGLEAKLDEIDKQSKETIEKLHVDFQIKLDQAFKKFQDSQKDKSSLVMKYADAEKRCIDLNRTIELLQSKLTDASKDKFKLEETIGKIRLEKNKLNEELESKLFEIKQLLLKIDKLKEDFVLIDAKNNVSQQKLKQEIDKNIQLNEEIERLKKIESEIESNLNSDANKSKDLLEEILRLKEKLIQLEEERDKLSTQLHDQKDMNKNLLTEVLKLKEHHMTLTKQIEEKNILLEKIDCLNSELNETQIELKQLEKKQSEFLELTSKLTEKNIQLQSENSILKEQAHHANVQLDTVKYELHQSNDKFQNTIKLLNDKLNGQTNINEQLNFKLSENLRQIDELSAKLNDERDEISSLKKKYAANIKDLTKQLQKLHKVNEKCSDSVVNSSASTMSITTTSNQTISRSNSLTSLDKETDIRSTNESISSGEQHQIQETQSHNDVYIVDIDKQRIIEKYVKLQKNLAKKNEKLDFLQDHVSHLTQDLQKKTKIIQAFAMKQEVGAFTSEEHDANKIDIARKKGLISNDNSHLICQEINNKLQSLLEDTLIKNITLKDSLETLGQEIARLSQENRRIKMKIQE